MTPQPGAHSSRGTRALAVVAAVCAVALLASSCSTRPSDTAFTGPTVFLPLSPSPAPSSDTPNPDIQATVPTASAQLLLQAKQLYMQYYTYETSLERQGGADQLPAPMAALLSGRALTDMTKTMQQAKKAGLHWVDGTEQYQVVKVVQLLDDVPNGTVIALQACEQSGGARLVHGDGTELSDASTAIFVHHYFMKYNDQHQLVITDILGGDKRLQTCPF